MYRAVIYIRYGRPEDGIPFFSNNCRTPEEAENLLNKAVDSGAATGGHLETKVDNVGWCVFYQKSNECP